MVILKSRCLASWAASLFVEWDISYLVLPGFLFLPCSLARRMTAWTTKKWAPFGHGQGRGPSRGLQRWGDEDWGRDSLLSSLWGTSGWLFLWTKHNLFSIIRLFTTLSFWIPVTIFSPPSFSSRDGGSSTVPIPGILHLPLQFPYALPALL